MNNEALNSEQFLQSSAKQHVEHDCFGWEDFEAWLHERGIRFLEANEFLAMEGDMLRGLYKGKNVTAWGVLLRGGRDSKHFLCAEDAINAKEYLELQGYPAEVFPIVAGENIQ